MDGNKMQMPFCKTFEINVVYIIYTKKARGLQIGIQLYRHFKGNNYMKTFVCIITYPISYDLTTRISFEDYLLFSSLISFYCGLIYKYITLNMFIMFVLR